MKRLRVAHVMVQPVLVYDDDESVMPFEKPVQPVPVALTLLGEHAEKIRRELVELQAELDQQEEAARDQSP